MHSESNQSMDQSEASIIVLEGPTEEIFRQSSQPKE
jgi:hypothetical protein